MEETTAQTNRSAAGAQSFPHKSLHTAVSAVEHLVIFSIGYGMSYKGLARQGGDLSPQVVVLSTGLLERRCAIRFKHADENLVIFRSHMDDLEANVE